LSCGRFDKLINLFLDGRLAQSQEQELKEHLSRCKDCREKLPFLQSVEQKAKQIKATEPSEEYWDAFSSRVREKIIARQEESSALGLKKLLEGIFSFSPLKVKVAAGVISLVFVFVVGKLYLEYRGEHILPSREAAQLKEQPKLERMDEELKEQPSPREEIGEEAPSTLKKPEAVEQGVAERGKRVLPSSKPAAEKTVSGTGEEAPSLPKATEEKTVPAAAPAVQIPAPAKGKAEEQAVVTESKPTGAGIHQEAEEKKAKIASVAEMAPSGTQDSLHGSGLKDELVVDLGLVSHQTTSRTAAYELDGNLIPKWGAADTAVQPDTLKRAIEVWRAYIQEHPADSLSKQGYLQIATAYYLLAKAGQDTSLVSEGSNLIEQYINQVQDPTVKSDLSSKLKQIQALKQK